MLHLVAFPPARSDLLRSLQHSVQPGDQVVFIEEGVLFCADTPDSQAALALLAGADLHCLADDATDSVTNPVTHTAALVSWDDIAALTETHAPCLSWY
ncbi:hypothetical protein K8B33_01840 [Alcanivorax sp. JB21]|uniref:DsrH/TusB family sulfur metabolism protein n=1 Tax=Alcanivorax limicola TaxID=2874102 RepID=UPI001CBC9659|nr:DsrH/TusB family sulfur metabolism protein [Alcanivorax limicola]MBZ2187828.1 hypothetical protein [Alcanivorax limicola]